MEREGFRVERLGIGSDDHFSGSHDPDMIKKYENKGVSVTVKENDRKTVELKAIQLEEER